jgi:hypothetical protein
VLHGGIEGAIEELMRALPVISNLQQMDLQRANTFGFWRLPHNNHIGYNPLVLEGRGG